LHSCIWELFFAWILVVLFCRWCRVLKVPNSCFQGEFCIKGRKNWEKCIYSGGVCIHAFGSSFSPDFSCALLWKVSSPFASPWGVGNFGAFYLGCVEPLPLP
jgi:hypothetical protein